MGMTIPALTTHSGDSLGMSPVRASSQPHARSAAVRRHRTNLRSIVNRARPGGDLAAGTQAGNAVTAYSAEFEHIFV
jgi:hypothetical protein